MCVFQKNKVGLLEALGKLTFNKRSVSYFPKKDESADARAGIILLFSIYIKLETFIYFGQ